MTESTYEVGADGQYVMPFLEPRPMKSAFGLWKGLELPSDMVEQIQRADVFGTTDLEYLFN